MFKEIPCRLTLFSYAVVLRCCFTFSPLWTHLEQGSL
jgi:hypothetical protein